MNKTSNNMNNVTNSIPLRKISIPELNSAEFATGLQNAFININKNFALLANHDFVKGETGQSVSIQEDKFFNDNGELTILGLKLKACIEGNASTNELINVEYVDENNIPHEISVWDNFTPTSAGTIQMIYNKINDNEITEPLSSLYYVFLDARYANDKIGSITRDDACAQQYANLKDMSCILVYDKNVSVTINQGGNDYTVNGGFKVLTNAFPTVYYEANVGLCWKINGSNTGIPVQGLPGRDGHNAITRIVKCNIAEKTEYGVVRGEVYQIHDNFNGYELIGDDILKYNDSAALVLITADGDDTISDFDPGFYFGKLKVENNKLYAYCDQQNSINHGLSTQYIIEAMKHIDINDNGIDGSQGIKGLYIPINKVDNEGVQPIHLISATSFSDDIGRGSGSASDKTDIIFTAINDINSFTDDDNLMVNKYLYVRINPENNIFYSNCDYTNRLASVDKYKGIILKYKLTDHVVDANSILINDVGGVDNSTTIASRYYGAITKQGESVSVQLKDKDDTANVKYYVYNSGRVTDSTPTYSNNHLDSMPDAFRDKLNINASQNNSGLYRWELCNTVDVFDVDELTKSISGTTYDFPNELGVIFTDTITPGENTNFLWFNGIQLADYLHFGFGTRNEGDANDNGIISTNDGTTTKTYYVVPGWYMSENEINGLERSVLLSFVKFIPVYENSMEYVGDTALNLNYNVNIGGNSNDHEKSLIVNGKINCNDLNVYNLTASGEIKKIYTRDTIVGDAGIKLAVKTDPKEGEDKYNLQIDDSGNITTTGDISNESMHTDKETNNVIVKSSVVAKKAKLTSLELNSEYDSEIPVVFAGNVGTPGNANEFKFGVELSNIHNIKLTRKEIVDTDNTPAKLPKLISDVTSINYNKSNLIVTNSEPNDSNLQYIGNIKKPAEQSSCSFDEIFNSNVASAYDTSSSFERSAGTSISAPYTTKSDQSDSTDTNKTLINILRSRPGEGGLSTALPNTYAAESSPKFKDCAGSSLTLKTESLNNTYIKDNTICKFILKRDANNISLSTSDNINIKFNSKFLVRLCCNGKCKNGNRPKLKDYSNITLHVYYVQAGKYKEIAELKNSYTFPEMRWFGETQDGQSYGDEYGWRFRYYDFIFKPKDLTISSGTAAFSDIYNTFKENANGVEIRIVASYNITFKGENSKDVIGGAFVHKPIPIIAEPGENNLPADNKQYTNITDGKLTKSVYAANNFSQSVNWNEIFNIGEGNIGNIQYYKVEESKSASFNSTTLCNDGIVIRSNDKTSIQIFGIGMKKMIIGETNKNIPRAVLRFYNKTSESTTGTDKVIDLESLFSKLSDVVTDISSDISTKPGTNVGDVFDNNLESGEIGKV